MTHLQKLQQNKLDNVLASFIIKNQVEALINNNKAFNRGDFFEMAITKEAVKRNGLHGISQGDFILNGEVIEIKYITKKTKASQQLKGTIANYYLIGFNNGSNIELRLIKKCDLVVNDNHLSYKDNYNKGVLVMG